MSAVRTSRKYFEVCDLRWIVSTGSWSVCPSNSEMLTKRCRKSDSERASSGRGDGRSPPTRAFWREERACPQRGTPSSLRVLNLKDGVRGLLEEEAAHGRLAPTLRTRLTGA